MYASQQMKPKSPSQTKQISSTTAGSKQTSPNFWSDTVGHWPLLWLTESKQITPNSLLVLKYVRPLFSYRTCWIQSKSKSPSNKPVPSLAGSKQTTSKHPNFPDRNTAWHWPVPWPAGSKQTTAASPAVPALSALDSLHHSLAPPWWWWWLHYCGEPADWCTACGRHGWPPGWWEG